MECGEYDGRSASVARGPGAVGLQLYFSSERVPVALGSGLPRQPACAAGTEPPRAARAHRVPRAAPPEDAPFMNDMDEITYWIYTKRAPCLMNYDQLTRLQSEEAQCSRAAPEEVHSPAPGKKKKKRKLSVLDDDSVSTEKQQNIFFDVPPKQILPVLTVRKSESLGSDVDFNFTHATVRDKTKKARLQKNNQQRTHKKSKVVTSTPKPTVNLRRSLRHVRQTTTDVNLNSSLEIFNNSMVSNGHVKNSVNTNQKLTDRVNKSTQIFAAGDRDQTSDNKRNSTNKSKPNAQLNGQLEDLSDVSGFTANYIRSTKVQSGKTAKKLRCKSSRNLVKESQPSSCRDQPRARDMVVCVNKTMNTGAPGNNMLNCSTDSSQNVINLVTTGTNHDKSGKTDKSTSLLKFVDTRLRSKEEAPNKAETKLTLNSNLHISFQSQSSATSRYPKRYKNHTDMSTEHEVTTRTRAVNKNCLEYNNSAKKENPQEAVVGRTRSSRNLSVVNRKRQESVLVVSNSTEQLSSLVSLNVASPAGLGARSKRRAPRLSRSKRADKSGQSLRKDSLRERSGFTTCFSESEEDSVPLGQRKYFCD